MTRKFRRSFLDFRFFLFGIFLFFSDGAIGQGIPAVIVKGLSSAKFAERESAQEELLKWSRKRPESSIRELHRQSMVAEDPEVRTRCMAALKKLVIEEEFRGDGYLGISMAEMTVQVPGEAEPRQGITINMVQPATAAEVAGLLPNQVIVGLDDRIWRKPGMMQDFAKIIRESRNGTEITLFLLDGGKVVWKKIRVGSKPEETERFFQRWLDKRESATR